MARVISRGLPEQSVYQDIQVSAVNQEHLVSQAPAANQV